MLWRWPWGPVSAWRRVELATLYPPSGPQRQPSAAGLVTADRHNARRGSRAAPSHHSPLALASLQPTLARLRREIVVGAERVGREQEALGRHHLGGVGLLRIVDLLEERVGRHLLLGDRIPG